MLLSEVATFNKSGDTIRDITIILKEIHVGNGMKNYNSNGLLMCGPI